MVVIVMVMMKIAYESVWTCLDIHTRRDTCMYIGMMAAGCRNRCWAWYRNRKIVMILIEVVVLRMITAFSLV